MAKYRRARTPLHGLPGYSRHEVYDGREYTTAQVEFMMAMDTYKLRKCRPFPTWCEVLQVLLSLGYHKGTRLRRPYER